MKQRLLLVTMLAAFALLAAAAPRVVETVPSPNGKIRIQVSIGDQLQYSVYYGEEQVLADNALALQVDNELFGQKPKLKGVKRSKVDEVIRPVVPLKYAEVPNKANQATFTFAGGVSVDFRAYDNGIAYRFNIKKGKKAVDVVDEGVELNFPVPFLAHISKTSTYAMSCEKPYTHISTAELKEGDEMTYLPILFESPRGTKVLFSESDVRDYPHIFLAPNGKNGFSSVFPKAPETWEPNGDRGWKITKEYDCIASHIYGSRSLPWRFAVIGDDATIAGNQMEVVLGGKCELDDVSWIKPGQVNWDWWNHWTVWGVDFETGDRKSVV